MNRGDDAAALLTATLLAEDETMLAMVDEPFQSLVTSEGEVVDMRPPELKVMVAEKEFRLHCEVGDFEQAIRCQVVRTTLIKLIYGNEHIRYTHAVLTLGTAYAERQRLFKQGLTHAQHAAQLYRRHLRRGDFKADAAESKLLEAEIKYVIGACKLGLKRIDEAEASLNDCYAVLTAPDAPEHDRLLDFKVGRTLGALHAAAGQWDAAAEKLQEAVILFETKAMKVTEDERTEVHVNLGTAMIRRGHNKASAEHFSKAAAFAAIAHGENSTAVAEVLETRARAHSRMGFEEEAEAPLTEALRIYTAIGGPEHKQALAMQEELIKLMIRIERYSDAVRLLKATLSLKCFTYGDRSSEVADTHQLLGNVRLIQGKLNIAIKHLKQARDIFSSRHGPAHIKTTRAAETLASIEAGKPKHKGSGFGRTI